MINLRNISIYLLIFLFFIPLPAFMYSTSFKLEGICSFLLFLLAVFFSLRYGLIVKSSNKLFFLLLFLLHILLPLFYALLGFFRMYDSYTIIKEFLFFSVSFVIFLTFEILFANDRYKILKKVILDLSLVVCLLLLVSEFYGLIHFTDRYLYRKIYLLTGSSLIYLGLILNIYYNGMFNLKNTAFIFSILLTLGRLNFIILCFIIASYIFYMVIWKNFHSRRLLLLGFCTVSLLALFVKIYYPQYLLTHVIKGSSIRWRQTEWKSALAYWQTANNGNIIFGNGLGFKLKTIKALKILRGGKIFLAIDRFHNLDLFLLLKFGIIGLIIFYSLVFFVLLVLLNHVMKQDNEIVKKFFLTSLLLIPFFIRSLVTGSITMSLTAGIWLGILYFFLANEIIDNKMTIKVEG